MKQVFVGSAVLSLTLVAALGAQTPAPPTTPPRPDQPAAQASSQEMTIVGCLAEDTTAPGSFILTVTPPDAARTSGAPGAPDATRATGAPPAARAGAAAQAAKYKITGLAADQLKPHLNHQVEFKGKASASAAAPAAPPAGAGAAAARPATEFQASAVKMVSATCPPAQ